jgi:cyclic pyranopterin phosphate synthase
MFMGSPCSRSPNTVYWLGDTLYLNITNRCSNDCYFCLRKFRNGVGGFNLKLQREPSVREIISELQEVINKKSWTEIVFCGFGEPMERLDCILEVTGWIRHCFGNRSRVRIDTNGHGYLLNEDRHVAKELENAGVDMVSVSLNAHDRETYDQVCRPQINNAYAGTLEFIQRARQNLKVEATAVTIPETDLVETERIARRMGVEFRTRQYVQGSW